MASVGLAVVAVVCAVLVLLTRYGGDVTVSGELTAALPTLSRTSGGSADVVRVATERVVPGRGIE